MPIENGTLLENRYRVETLLNVGGMGAVYRAWDTRLDCYVALKENTLEMTPSTAEQFMREAKTLARLRHPHLPRVSDYFVLPNGAQYLVMEYVEGDDLAKRIEWHGPMEEAEALAVIEQVCDALTYLHSQSPPVIHRDVKPANIKITPQGEVILVDFGIVKVGDAKKRTATGAVGVSPGYSPLEQYGMGGTDVPSDIYALGATLYTMVTGETPPESVDRASGSVPLSPPRTLRPALSAEVARAIETAMAVRVTDRLATVAAFKGRLQRKAPSPPPTQASTHERKVQTPPARHPALPGWAWGIGGAAIVLVALMIGGAFRGQGASPLPTEHPTPTPLETQDGAVIMPSPSSTATEAPMAASTSEPTPTYTPVSPRAGDTRVSPQDSAVMVYIPAGEFQMGSTDAEVEAVVEQCVVAGFERGDCEGWVEDEQPVHTVALDAFWIDQTEITNAQYTRCVDDGACEPSEHADNAGFNGDDYPVVGVSWHDAVAYCTWAEKRLPTEAEWEYAARGPEARIYPWGDAFDGTRCNFCDVNCEYDWADKAVDDGYAMTAPVGSFPDGASWAGALDMAGNVWEWVADWHGEYPSERQENPTGPETGEYRVLRGGGWDIYARNVRAAYRIRLTPTIRYLNVGFRCAIAARQGP